MRQIRRRYGDQGRLTALKEWFVEYKRITFPIGGFLLLELLIQLLYPAHTALPFARLNSDMVGLSKSSGIIEKMKRDYGSTSVTTKIRGNTIKTPVAETGIITDNTAILTGVSQYPWYLRVLPFSLFIKGALTDEQVKTTVDPTRFTIYASERALECTVEPKNAGVVVREGNVELDPAKNGQECSKQSLQRQLTSQPLSKNGLSVAIKTSPVKPKRSDADIQPLLKEARAISEHKLTLNVAGKVYDVDKPTLASWLAFPEDPKTNKVSVGLNDDVVKTYLTTIQKDIYIAPGVTLITTKDGIETDRVPGSSGRGIDLDKTLEAIRAQVLKADGDVEATLTVLPPTLRYNRSYSKTPEGLQALVNDIVKDKGDFAISVRKLGDSGVNANGNKQYHPASTYKLFVAYSTLKRIDSGQFTWGQTTSGGQTLSQCFDNMIVNSDNACAEWFGATIGWNTLTIEAHSLGANSTSLSRPFVSTANDQALFLQKLESNQLGLTEPSRARLIEAMKRQVYRKGIPAGVGVPVADKVGFLDGYLHDSAIVYAPSGVYVLVIYSNNSSWSAIADAARQIHQQLQ